MQRPRQLTDRAGAEGMGMAAGVDVWGGSMWVLPLCG